MTDQTRAAREVDAETARDIEIMNVVLPPLSEEQMQWEPEVIAQVKQMPLVELHRSVLACQQVIVEREMQLRAQTVELNRAKSLLRRIAQYAEISEDGELLQSPLMAYIDAFLKGEDRSGQEPCRYPNCDCSSGQNERCNKPLPATEGQPQETLEMKARKAAEEIVGIFDIAVPRGVRYANGIKQTIQIIIEQNMKGLHR